MKVDGNQSERLFFCLGDKSPPPMLALRPIVEPPRTRFLPLTGNLVWGWYKPSIAVPSPNHSTNNPSKNFTQIQISTTQSQRTLPKSPIKRLFLAKRPQLPGRVQLCLGILPMPNNGEKFWLASA